MDFDTILGIVFVALGVLAILGEVSFGFILPFLGIVLVVVGVLILGNVLEAGTLTGIVSLLVGLLLYSERVGVPASVSRYINLIVGVILLVLGLREIA